MPLNPTRYFAANVQTALDGGRIVAKFLNEIMTSEIEESCQYIIVAHSLGCWLAAEMMAEMRRLNAPACNKLKLILMAGAVPTVDVENDNLYGGALVSALNVSNLYSPDDRVLRWLFPIGEIPDGRLGLEAIGLNGAPTNFAWSQREQMTRFDHGDYWTKAPSAEFLARLLGAPVPMTLPANDIPSYHPPEYSPL